MAKPIIIFGVGEQAEVAWWYFTKHGATVEAFCVDEKYLPADGRFCERNVIAFSDVARHFGPRNYDMHVAIGYSRLNAVRVEKCVAARALGYTLASFLHPEAVVSTDAIGVNVFILEHNTVQPFVTVGDYCVLWSGNHIGHHSRLGDGVFVTSHAVISGGVTIGARSFIGVNATIADHVEIGEGCLVGAGALVTADLKANGVCAAEADKPSRAPADRVRL